MRLRSLEVHNFRIIRHTKLEFADGLNVLYGPNELGKSTLVDALRAAFLLPVGSKAIEELVPWGTDDVPRVTVEFELPDTVVAESETANEGTKDQTAPKATSTRWRVSKSFGGGARSTATLERLAANGRVLEEVRGRDVDGRLRALLSWGIPAPGGKGAPRGRPESYLTTALLGDQERVVAIFDTDIDKDGADSGRSRLTDALGALAQEPKVTAILDRLDRQVRHVFTDSGQRRRTQESPLVRCTDEIRLQDDIVKQLEVEVDQARQVEGNLQRLGEQAAETDQRCRLLVRQIEHSRAVLLAQKELTLAVEQEIAAQKTAAEVRETEVQLAACESRQREASESLRLLNEQSQVARLRLAATVAKRNQLQAHAVESCESRRAQLEAQRDAALRESATIQQVVDAALAVETQRDEFDRAQQALRDASTKHLLAAKLFTLIRLRDQELQLQHAESEWQSAALSSGEREAEWQAAKQNFETVNELWQDARQEAVRAAEKLRQIQSSSKTDRDSQQSALLAKQQAAQLRLDIATDAITAAQNTKIQQAELEAATQQFEGAKAAVEQAIKLSQLADLEAQRSEEAALLEELQASLTEEAKQRERVSCAAANFDAHSKALVTARQLLHSHNEAIERSKREARERQLRRDELRSGQLRAQAAADRVRDELAVLRAEEEGLQRLVDAEHRLTEAEDARRQIDIELTQHTAARGSTTQRAVRCLVAAIGFGIGAGVTLLLAFGVPEMRGLCLAASALLGFGGGGTGWLWLRTRHELAQLETQRERCVERRNEIVSTCVMTKSQVESARREHERQLSRVAERASGPERSEEQSRARLAAAMEELRQIEVELDLLPAKEVEAPTATPQELNALTQQVRCHEEELQSANALLEATRRELYLAESRARSAEDAVKTLNLPVVEEQIAVLRSETRLKPWQPIPSQTEALVQERAARESLARAESQATIAAQRLHDRDTEFAELARQIPLPPEQALAAAEADLRNLATLLEQIDAVAESNIQLAQQELDKAESVEADLGQQCTVARSSLEAADESLREARQIENAKRLDLASVAATALRRNDASLTEPHIEVMLDSLAVESNSGSVIDVSSSEAFRIELPRLNALVATLSAEASGGASSNAWTLDRAKSAESNTRTLLDEADRRSQMAQEMLVDRESRHAQLAASLGRPVDEALAETDRRRCEAEDELSGIESASSTDLENVTAECDQAEAVVSELDAQIAQAKSIADDATEAFESSRQAREAARLRQSRETPVAPLNVEAARETLAQRTRELELEFPATTASDSQVAAHERELEHWSNELARINRLLHETRGQLNLSGGAVAKERLEEATEELHRQQTQATELEQEFEAMWYLLQKLKTADAQHTAHLGRSLAKPVSELFKTLTGDRYTQVALTPNLTLNGVVASHAERSADRMSVGARHQLATLLRLSLAAYLRTTVILDDQLTHSDPHRLLWFREQLQSSVRDHGHQVFVITCRPLDYVNAEALPNDGDPLRLEEPNLCVIDLNRLLVRR